MTAPGVGYAPTLARVESAASNNATVVKVGPGSISDVVVANANAAIRYMKFYDLARAPLPASDVPKLKLILAANGLQTIYAPANPPNFLVGIAYIIVTGATDTDNTAPAANEIAGAINFY